MLSRSPLLPMLILFGWSLIASAAAAAPAVPAAATLSCDLNLADRNWLNEATDAWRYSIRRFANARVQQLDAVIFDKGCMVTSPTAMTGGAARWSGRTHNGLLSLPDGQSLPAQVASFAAPAPNGAFFVMAAPSIWREGGVQSGGLPLAKLTKAVLLHEGIHVLQLPTYGREMSDLTARHGLPESFDDDSIQAQFEKNAEYANSVERETELLFAAAAAPKLANARKLAREARALMRQRQQRWLTGKDAHLRKAEEIWLTMEGSGQWLAYRWLTDPRGGGVKTSVALRDFAKRGKWWSQKQGIALFLVLDRVAPSTWKHQVFGGSTDKATELVDAVL